MQKSTLSYTRYALTLGEQSEIHVGCPIYGNGLAEEGFTLEELDDVNSQLPDSEVTRFHHILPSSVQQNNRACLLLIRNGINTIMNDQYYADDMLDEQNNISYDRKYFDSRKKKMLNKVARYNTVFGDEHVDHSEDYYQSTITSYDEVPLFRDFRKKLPDIFGQKAINLNAEGNHYYQKTSGIGFHGDVERKIVICVSLGESTTLRFYWRPPGSSECYGQSFDFRVKHGDIYVMSEKATGHDWKKRSGYRLVHGAGNEKYTRIK